MDYARPSVHPFIGSSVHGHPSQGGLAWPTLCRRSLRWSMGHSPLIPCPVPDAVGRPSTYATYG